MCMQLRMKIKNTEYSNEPKETLILRTCLYEIECSNKVEKTIYRVFPKSRQSTMET